MAKTKIKFTLESGYTFSAEFPEKIELEDLADVLKDLVDQAEENNKDE
jgi:uncharacterized protein YggL (DUF469 family)